MLLWDNLTWDYLMWSYFVITPLYVVLTYKSLRQQVIANPAIRMGLYSSSIIGLWIPMLILLAYQNQFPSFAPSFKIIGSYNNWWIAIAITLLFLTTFLAWSLISLKANTDKDKSLVKGLTPIQWLLPATPKELRRFIFLVSPSAGICEEILYRGLLLGFLSQNLSVTSAVIISSVAFGAPHLYQGWTGFIKTALLGAIMAIMTVLSESLLLAIILHTVIDIYMGILGYIILTRQKQQSNLALTPNLKETV
jgi:membrane protease YdiL (CAAX protease family)